MKHLWIQIIGLFILLGLIACSEGDNESCSIIVQDIQGPIESGEILKSTSLDNHVYKFTFESKSIEIPEKMVQNIDVDSAKWRTVLTLVDGNTYIIPSMGTSIDELIVNVTVNPSGYNPLAANITMNLPALGRLKIVVHSKPDSYTPDVEYLFNSIEKGQTVTVLGLYPNYENQVDLIYTDKQGNERGRTKLKICTTDLEDLYLPHRIQVKKALVAQMEPGMNLVNSPGESDAETSIPYMVDTDGNIRWILDWKKHPELNHIGAHCGLHRLKNGNYITGDANNHQLVEVDVLGNIVRKCDLAMWGLTYHHEIRETSEGRWLVTVTNQNAKLVDNLNTRILDHIAEFDPQTESQMKLWDLAQLLDTARMVRADQDIPGSDLYGQSKSNWLHNNGIDIYDNGDMLCTARWMGVFRFTRDGILKWIIAPHDRWRESYRRYLLTPLDKNGNPITDPDVLNGRKTHPDFDWVWGVHCPVVLSNGNVMVFDNGYCRNYNSRHNSYYSRVVEYEIDEANMSIRQVWEFGKDLGLDYYANAVSGVQELTQTGNRLFCPGTGGSHIVEIDPENEEIVFDLSIEINSNMAFHRANRINLYPDNM